MDISEVKEILKRRMKSAESELENPENGDDSRYYYFRGAIKELESIYYELLDKGGTLNEPKTNPKNPKNHGPKVFFKVFKDNRVEGKSCVDKLNEYIQNKPNLKIVNTQMAQYTESRYGEAVLNRWDPQNTFLAEQILVQFERISG